MLAKPVTYQATIEAGAAAASRILDAFEEAHAPSASAVGMFERGPDKFEVFAYYEAAPARDDLLRLIAGAVRGDGIGALRVEAVAEADWVTLSQGKRGPVEVGRFFVHGSHDRTSAPAHRFVVEIDAGQAFGTAHHASTRGCLIALDDALKRRRPKRILDLGTGSGILAIAAANAAKTSVVASDSDPVAVSTAASNTRGNCAWPRVRLIKADGLSHPHLRRMKPDFVFANLLERALHDLAPSLARHLDACATLVLSGITQDQARGIEARYRAYGFVLKRRILVDGWATLVLARPELARATNRGRD
jgi:ribosomal protein L11 methyltransferase